MLKCGWTVGGAVWAVGWVCLGRWMGLIGSLDRANWVMIGLIGSLDGANWVVG